MADTLPQHPTSPSQTMTVQTPFQEKRIAPETGTAINAIIAACNKNDRFKLLEDDTVPPANLDNPIHPVFNFVDTDGPMQQMLLLASQFLTHDSLLEFFIPLLYGRELTSTISGSSKTYLSDPLANVSPAKKAEYLNGVRSALHCLGHCLEFQYADPGKRIFARTLLSTRKPFRASTCFPLFQMKHSCLIELASYFGTYYTDPNGYEAATRSAQFRHDFLFATTLVHEIVHAIGVMKRGDLDEPHVRADCPDTEWGYAWEHFMFGNIINPQDRTRPGTHLLMRKVWAGQKAAAAAGGKEYCDVPMVYIAQWFRRETWEVVAEEGPAGIPAPTAHFKIQSSNKLGAWIVSSDCPDVLPDLRVLYEKWQQHPPGNATAPARTRSGKVKSNDIKWRLMTTEELQKEYVKAPVRIPTRTQVCLTCGQAASCTRKKTRVPEKSIAPAVEPEESVAVCRASSPPDSKSTRKRSADAQDERDCARKKTKR